MVYVVFNSTGMVYVVFKKGENMDPIIMTLAANAVAYLVPYVKKGAEEFAGDVGKAATGKVKNLLNALKTRLSGDKEATDQLIYFEKDPETYKSVLETILQKRLDQDTDLAAELEILIKEIKETSPNLEVYIKMTEGEDVTGMKAKEMKKGKAKVDIGIVKGKKVVGVEIDRIG